jgi:hypothetical protein
MLSSFLLHSSRPKEPQVIVLALRCIISRVSLVWELIGHVDLAGTF